MTVLERNADVIALVSPHLAHDRLKVLAGDAKQEAGLDGQKFDSIWLDIWCDFCSDNLRPMAALTKQYRKRLRPGGFIGCWSQEETRRLARRGIV